jgi:hypothetical protein
MWTFTIQITFMAQTISTTIFGEFHFHVALLPAQIAWIFPFFILNGFAK